MAKRNIKGVNFTYELTYDLSFTTKYCTLWEKSSGEFYITNRYAPKRKLKATDIKIISNKQFLSFQLDGTKYKTRLSRKSKVTKAKKVTTLLHPLVKAALLTGYGWENSLHIEFKDKKGTFAVERKKNDYLAYKFDDTQGTWEICSNTSFTPKTNTLTFYYKNKSHGFKLAEKNVIKHMKGKFKKKPTKYTHTKVTAKLVKHEEFQDDKYLEFKLDNNRFAIEMCKNSQPSLWIFNMHTNKIDRRNETIQFITHDTGNKNLLYFTITLDENKQQPTVQLTNGGHRLIEIKNANRKIFEFANSKFVDHKGKPSKEDKNVQKTDDRKPSNELIFKLLAASITLSGLFMAGHFVQKALRENILWLLGPKFAATNVFMLTWNAAAFWALGATILGLAVYGTYRLCVDLFKTYYPNDYDNKEIVTSVKEIVTCRKIPKRKTTNDSLTKTIRKAYAMGTLLKFLLTALGTAAVWSTVGVASVAAFVPMVIYGLISLLSRVFCKYDAEATNSKRAIEPKFVYPIYDYFFKNNENNNPKIESDA